MRSGTYHNIDDAYTIDCSIVNTSIVFHWRGDLAGETPQQLIATVDDAEPIILAAVALWGNGASVAYHIALTGGDDRMM